MVQSNAKTVAEYLKSLPPERRKVMAAVRKVIRANLPPGYVEMMGYGMMGVCGAAQAVSQHVQRAAAALCGTGSPETFLRGLFELHLYRA